MSKIANKLSLNLEKIERIMLRKPNSKLNNTIKIKVNQKKTNAKNVKHFGVLLDKYLTCCLQI